MTATGASTAKTTAAKTSSAKPAASRAVAVRTAAAAGESDLITSQGRTTITDTVVAKIAGIAAREVSGVYRIGGGMTRALSAVQDRIGARGSAAQGVAVEVGEREAAVDLILVVDYGVEIGELTRAVRRNIIESIERMTALDVTEVNIVVEDVHIAGDDDDAESRVQ